MKQKEYEIVDPRLSQYFYKKKWRAKFSVACLIKENLCCQKNVRKQKQKYNCARIQTIQLPYKILLFESGFRKGSSRSPKYYLYKIQKLSEIILVIITYISFYFVILNIHG